MAGPVHRRQLRENRFIYFFVLALFYSAITITMLFIRKWDISTRHLVISTLLTDYCMVGLTLENCTYLTIIQLSALVGLLHKSGR